MVLLPSTRLPVRAAERAAARPILVSASSSFRIANGVTGWSFASSRPEASAAALAGCVRAPAASPLSARWSEVLSVPASTALVSFSIGHPERAAGLSPRRALLDVRR